MRRVAVVVLALSALGFALVAALVAGGAADGADRWIVAGVRAAGGAAGSPGAGWASAFFLDITHLGGQATLGLVGVLAGGWLAVLRRWRALAFLAGALGLGWELSSVLKEVFLRARPEVVLPAVVAETSPSFPSGHATRAALCWGALALLAMPLAPSRAARLWLAGAAVLIVLLVGVSRVWLGVHWPGDVIAGWCLGAAWVAGWWLALRP